MVLDRTSFRIRVLTKNAVVGSKPWVDFFAKHGDRFVVGLSTRYAGQRVGQDGRK